MFGFRRATRWRKKQRFIGLRITIKKCFVGVAFSLRLPSFSDIREEIESVGKKVIRRENFAATRIILDTLKSNIRNNCKMFLKNNFLSPQSTPHERASRLQIPPSTKTENTRQVAIIQRSIERLATSPQRID